MENFNEPVKCKECSIWWRGQEHKCKSVTTNPFNPEPKKPPFDKFKEKKGCPLCGATGPHYCQGPKRDTTYTCHRCGKTHDYRYTYNCDPDKNPHE